MVSILTRPREQCSFDKLWFLDRFTRADEMTFKGDAFSLFCKESGTIKHFRNVSILCIFLFATSLKTVFINLGV